MSLGRGTCRSCGASILWAQSATGRPMPLNSAVQKGVVLEAGVARVVDVYTSHFASCPHGDSHRQSRSTTIKE